jgi:hypothetical protein
MQILVQDTVFFSILRCHVGDHSQGDLAMFGYRTTMKVEIDWNPSISWLLNWTMRRIFFYSLKTKWWRLNRILFKKKDIFPDGENSLQKKELK